MPTLPISSDELDQRLKSRWVFVLPGHYFFPGMSEDWPHREQCIRITYSQDSDAVRSGIAIIGEEVRNACNPDRS